MNQIEFYTPATPGTLTPLSLFPLPDNWQALMVELSFENGSPMGVLNATKLIWKGESAHYMNEWIATGLQGGVGIMEGIPLVIKICKTQEIVFNGIIDLSDSETKITCDIIEAKIRDKRMDMFTANFERISYYFLTTLPVGAAGRIDPRPQYLGGDYVVIPYQKNNVPDGLAFFTTGLAIFNIARETYAIANQLLGLVQGGIAASAVVGVGAVILAVFQVIYYTIYFALMALVIFALMRAAFNYLVSPVMTKFGMTAATLMKKACDYFNLGFSSSLTFLLDREIIMPAKQAWINNQSFTRTLFNNLIGGSQQSNRMEYDDLTNHLNGGMAYGYWDGTPADFFRAIGDKYNAKAKIILNNAGNPVLHFERWDYIYNLANYTLTNISDQVPFNSKGIFNTTGFSQSAAATNASELPANYMVRYAMDDQDSNTYNYYDGTMCYCTTTPNVVNDTSHVVLQNLVEKNLIFSQAFRKDKLTAEEEALIPLWQAAAAIVNLIIGATNGIDTVINSVLSLISVPPLPTLANGGLQYMPSMPAFANTGHLLLTNDHTSVPKIFIAGPNQSYNNYFDFQSHTFTGVTVDVNNKDLIGAKALMKNFHFSNLPLTVVPPAPYNQPYVAGASYHNQWILYRGQKIPLCCEEYDLIKNNNIIKNFQGQFARVDSLKWTLFKSMADIDYRVNFKYTNNLKTTFTIDGATIVNSL